MRKILTIAAVLSAFAAGSALKADEETKEYVTALRNEGFADLAIEYLKLQLAKPGLSADDRAEVEFEIATSLTAASDALGDLSKREQMLEESRAKFEEYVKKYPKADPIKKAEALVSVATIDLRQGRLRVVQAQLPSNAGQTQALAAQARQYFTKASTDYEEATKTLDAAYKKFPVFIPDERAEDRALRRQKTDVFEKYIEARFQAALARFFLADSYASIDLPEPKDPKDAKAMEAYKAEKAKLDKQYKETIEEARKGFEAIYNDHRRELVGLYGHLWMARCLAAQGDHRRAMGIFQLLQEHENTALARFQREVFHFMMLSFAARKEYDQIFNLAVPWLRENIKFSRESAYMGVQMELAKAYLSVGEASKDPKEKQKNYMEADQLFGRLVGSNNEYAGLASREQLKLAGVLDKSVGGRGFNRLFSLANAKLDLVKPETPVEEKKTILKEAKKLFMDAIAQAGASDTDDMINDARLALAYAHLQDNELYDGAVLAEYLAREFPKSRSAPQAAFFAVQAYAYAYEDAMELQKQNVISYPEVDANKLKEIAAYMATRWPDAKETADVQMTVGRLEFSRKNFKEALEAFESVQPSNPNYADAQSLAGLVCWEGYKFLGRQEAADPEKLKALRTRAIDSLAKASPLLKQANPGAINRTIFVNDAMLGEVYYENGNDKEAIAAMAPIINVLAGNADSIPSEIDPQLRIGVLTTALQCYIRLNDLSRSDELITLIGKQRGSEESGNVTRVFVSLASRIKDQIERLKAAGDTAKLNETVAAFEGFLDRIAGREEGQTMNTRIYIANSFIEIDKHGKAIDLLQTAISDPAAAEEANKPVVTRAELLLAKSYRMQGEFTQARELIDKLFKSNSNIPEILIERGDVIEASLAASNSPKDLNDAIIHWKTLIQRMQKAKPRPDTFYVAMDRLMTLYETKIPAAEKTKRLGEGYKYAKFLLTLDPNLPADWKPRFQEHLKRIEDGLGIKSDEQARAGN